MKDIDLLLFDLDGTLVDSRKDITNAVNFTLKELGLKEKGLPEISSYIGRGVEDLIRKSLGKEKEEFFKKAVSVFEKYYRRHSTDQSELYAGVKEILNYFKNKRKIIVTNRKYEFAVLTLKTLNIYDYFEEVIGGDNLGCIKPSACPLNNTLYKFDVAKKRAIIIGDMAIDVMAGKKAGIFTCAVTYGIGKKEDIIKTKPDFIIDNIIELKNIIR